MTEAEFQAFNAHYMQVLDDEAYESWPDFFTPDGLYRLWPRDNMEAGLPGCLMYFAGQGMMRDRILAIAQVFVRAPHRSRHFAGYPVIGTEDRGAIAVRSSFQIVHTDATGRSSLFATGEYCDKVVREDRLKLKERAVILDTFRIQSQLAEPL